VNKQLEEQIRFRFVDLLYTLRQRNKGKEGLYFIAFDTVSGKAVGEFLPARMMRKQGFSPEAQRLIKNLNLQKEIGVMVEGELKIVDLSVLEQEYRDGQATC
jgi:hypothetical protein